MKIGVIKEIKDQEKRVGLTPSNVKDLIDNGHSVFIETNAGVGSGYVDDEYLGAGAVIESTPEQVVNHIDLLVKIKEPLTSEFHLLELLKNKSLYTFLHLAANKPLAQELCRNNITAVSYDTIEDEQGNLPMLRPMSVIAGHLSAELALKHKGTLDRVFVLGGGVAGRAAAEKAVELGCSSVTVYEPNSERCKQLEEYFYDHPVDVASCLKHVTKELNRSDVIVGAALVKGQKAPQVLSEEMVKNLKQGAFIVDISIDQGGCIFGSVPTSHSEPTYEFEGKTFCCIPNLPGSKPREATKALTRLSYPLLLDWANKGLEEACRGLVGSAKGINVMGGKVVNDVVAKELEM
jgi:alanine dehydrogenase